MADERNDWDESEHPRAEDGEFTDAGGGGSNKGGDGKTSPKGLPHAGFHGTTETPEQFHTRQAKKYELAASKGQGLGSEHNLKKAAEHRKAAEEARANSDPDNDPRLSQRTKDLIAEAKRRDPDRPPGGVYNEAHYARMREIAKARNLAVKAHENGGFTFSPTTGDFPSEGYAVSIHPEHEVKWKGKEALDPKHVQEYLGARKEFFEKNPHAHLGGWYNPEDDTWYLDVSHLTHDKKEAVSLGARYNQKGIYDLKEGRTIPDSEYGEVAAGERGDSARWRDPRLLRPTETVAGGDRGGHGSHPQGSSPQGGVGRVVRLDDVLVDLRTRRDELDRRIQTLRWVLRYDEFDESEHPRAEDGKWTDGSGGGGKSPDEVDRELSGRGPKISTKAKGPSEGLKKIAAGVDKHYEDVSKKDTLLARATRLEPREHAYLEARAQGERTRDSKMEKSIASKLGIDVDHLDEVAHDYHEHGVAKEVETKRREWQGGAAGHLDTLEAYKRDGKWTPERERIHNEYIESTLKGVPKTAEPVFYMTGGGPASGKTTGLLENEKASIPDKTKAAHINADDAKEWLPEYGAGKKAKDAYAASFVHEESSETAKAGVERALKEGHNVVFDSTGDSGIDKLEKKIQSYRAMGAKKVIANYAVIDIDEAIRRSDLRAQRSGRFVPHAYLRSNHVDVARTLKGAIDRKLFDKLDIWDTSGVNKPPVHVASFTKEGGLKIHDEGLWEKTLARAKQSEE